MSCPFLAEGVVAIAGITQEHIMLAFNKNHNFTTSSS